MMTTMGEADEAEGIVAEAADQEVDVGEGEDEDEERTMEVKALVKAVASLRRRAIFVKILGIWNETARSKCGTKRSI